MVIVNTRDTIWLVAETASVIIWIACYAATIGGTLIGRPRALPVLLTSAADCLSISILATNGRSTAAAFVGKHGTGTTRALNTDGVLHIVAII
jgi:hypothetical protein